MASMFESGEERPLGRILFLQVLLIAVFVIYALRLFNMQIISGEQYRQRSYNIARRTTVIPARRGEIYDRTFTEPIVVNEDSYAVSLTPAEVPDGKMPEIITRLSNMLKLPQREIENKIPPQYYHLYQPLEIASVPFETLAVLSENADSLPGLNWQSRPIRNYGDIGSLSHIIGYVGNITRDELIQLYNEGYQQGDVIGKLGLEREYDSMLRGKEGMETRTVDVYYRNIAGEARRVPPEMGKNLVLTLDRDIQLLTEKALGPRMGTAIVMKANGEILAMVSYPWYDPNIFNSANRSGEYQRLIDNPNKPFLNRAIQSSYPPASTFKILMTTGLLAENLINPEQRIRCAGMIDYGQRSWRCWVHSGHGWVNLQQALAGSCDIYFWTAGRDNMGVDRIVNFAREFGYGKNTGIDLPGEISGFIPSSQWKERVSHERWVAGDTMNMAIGQGFTLVTPLQITNMVATVANDGLGYRPHILKEVRDPVSGAIEKTVTPEIIHDMRDKVSPQVFASVKYDMRTVVTEGSARAACNIRTVELAGKTGTAEIGLPDRWHCWFTAYGPYNTGNHDEQIVVTVLVEASNPWDWWSPYATAIIFQGIFAGQTYEEAVVSLGLQNFAPAQQGRRE
jgi:penicillin-binding protein 2